MGILNVTPDSFSDGGRYRTVQEAVDRAEVMVREGADLIDVGPESTRPGADPVPAAEQIDRACPVIEAFRRRDRTTPISIDTQLAAVAEAALHAGADMINDVSALRRDPEMVALAARAKVPVVLMHMRGTPKTMQRGGGPRYDDVVAEIARFLEERRTFARAHGIEDPRIVLDPGIGFGKRPSDNVTILAHLDRLTALGRPVLLGASRKSFLGKLLDRPAPVERDNASVACAVLGAWMGAAILRVHDVVHTVEALRLTAAVARARR
ncbi:MAG: dihydropteroate synthase [Planctomycetota bacterium]|nr:MAG: dihydropteroate synthase [Planctomycetota bacterium]